MTYPNPPGDPGYGPPPPDQPAADPTRPPAIPPQPYYPAGPQWAPHDSTPPQVAVPSPGPGGSAQFYAAQYQPGEPSPFSAQQPIQAYQPPYPSYGYPYAGPPYGYPPQRPTEGMAIAAMVVSCVGVVGLCSYGIGGVMGLVGAILGHVARRRIRQNGHGGEGMALAGIIVGWILTAVSAAIAILVVTLVASEGP